MFSGPDRQDEGFDAFASTFGFEVEMWDILRDKSLDLVDERNLQTLLSRIEAKEFAAVLMSPPCSTFCRAMDLPGGPKPVRASHGPELMGYKG